MTMNIQTFLCMFHFFKTNKKKLPNKQHKTYHVKSMHPIAYQGRQEGHYPKPFQLVLG
jgi:hypothetical protein